LDGTARLPGAAVIVKNAGKFRARMRRVLRVITRLIVAVVVVAAVLVVVAGLRLMAGPIDLDFLRDRIAQQFDTPGGPMRVVAERVYGEWAGLSEPMRLVFTGLKVTDRQHQTVATAPSVALSFEPRSVVRGHPLPTAIVVRRPTLNADIDREGGMLQRILAQTDSSSQGEVVQLLIDQLLKEPNSDSLLGRLDTVLVEHARVSLRDKPSGVVWLAPDAHAQLKRDASGVIISAGAKFSNGGEPVDVALSGIYARDRSRISVEATIDNLKPSVLAVLSPDAALLRGVDIALSGRMRIEAGGDGAVRTISLDVRGGEGSLTLPGILPVSHKVHSIDAAASVDAASHTAKIDHIRARIGPAELSIAGTGKRTDEGQSFAGRAEIKGIPIDRLGDYWPLDLAGGGRAWALANLSNGSLDVAAEFALSAPGDNVSQVKIDRNVAFLDYRGMTVHYMPHMPELQNVSGSARFEGNTLHFDVAGGTAVGLAMAGGKIDLANLDGPSEQQTATLRLPISGPAPIIMAFLARPKLGLPRDALYDPKRVGGDVAIELTLAFPLLNALAVSDIDIKAEASLSGFSLKNALGGVDLTDAVGRVGYSNSELVVTGTGKLDGNAVEVAWREMFAPKAPFRQRYELKGTLPAEVVAKAGFPSPTPYLSGPLGLALTYQTSANGTGDVAAKVDLKGAKAAVPELDWSKEAGTDGKLDFTLKLAPGGKLTTADFDTKADGLSAKGQVRFNGDSQVQQVALQGITLGRSSLVVDWRPVIGGSEIVVGGRALDLVRFRQILHKRDEMTKGEPSTSSTKVTFRLDQVLTRHGTLGGLNGGVMLAGEHIMSADLTIGGGKGSTFRVMPGKDGRSLAFYVADLGVLLREAGWVDGFIGGYVDFRGRFDDAAADTPLDGTLKFGPYRLEKVTARDGIGTMNSTIDGLNRGGNALQQFDGLEAEIHKVGDKIDVRKGRTSGHSIGLTTQGTIDLGNDTASLRGIVVPGFALNNLLSNVPLLGPLLTGGKDGGVFAITYRLNGPLDDLKSDINMMSAVTPGALRGLFTGMSDGTAPTLSTQPDTRQTP